jgi:uncharacterized FAD-dependent dehydrogenase
MALLVMNVPWPEGVEPTGAVARALRVGRAAVRDVAVVRRSLDARARPPVWRATVRAELEDEAAVLRRRIVGVRAFTERDEARYGRTDRRPVPRIAPFRPVVVGTGPAGLYAALWLAEAGVPPVLLERGSPVETRVGEVNGAWRDAARLDPESNTVFGEGGAGTFSDGKVYTRRRDGDVGLILRRLVDFGADASILDDGWAHLGTDRIRALLPAFRARLAELGVEIRFRARVDGLLGMPSGVAGVRLSDGSELAGAPVIVAAGHSARDTAAWLCAAGVRAEPRPIAVGARVEHPQALIDAGRYGGARPDGLPPASYRLSHNPPDGRKAFTFCQCPGGMVVPAGHEAGAVVVNGMSFAARRAYWANSAVIVEVLPADYGATDPLAGQRWQDAIERRCFERAGGTGAAPAQRVADLLAGRPSADLPRTSFPHGVVPVPLWDVLPKAVVDGMIAALRRWDAQVPGFAGADGVLIAPETRTTSPVRFIRDDGGETVGVKGLYVAGEGAGFGGGIVSSALDGLRVAERVLERASAR